MLWHNLVLMSTLCPSCKSTIGVEDINVSTDLALCRACGKTFRFSEIVDGSQRTGPDLASPPSGAWFEQLPGGFTIGATTRSWMAAFLIPFTCAWSGISMFGIYGSQFISGHLNFAASLFGLPFLIGTCFLLCGCALTVAGKTVITRNADRLSVFNGVGWLGLTRNYAWSDFRTAREDFATGSYNFSAGGRGRTIALEGKRRITFGSMLTNDRRYFVLCALRSMLGSESGSQVSSWPTSTFR